MTSPSIRQTHAYAFILCTSLVLASFYFQFVQHLEPCPICITQRFVFMLLSVLFLVGWIAKFQRPVFRYSHNGLVILVSLLGVGVSGRQIWLQHLPADQAPACGPGLNYMLENLPVGKTLHLLFYGAGECAQVDWTLLGFSMAEWAFVCFVLFALVGVWNIVRAKC